VGTSYTTAAGRANLEASLSIACTGSDEAHTAEILLDSIGSGLPWRHWAIVRSELGGTAVSAWCQ
jgi:hypothetical protein